MTLIWTGVILVALCIVTALVSGVAFGVAAILILVVQGVHLNSVRGHHHGH